MTSQCKTMHIFILTDVVREAMVNAADSQTLLWASCLSIVSLLVLRLLVWFKVLKIKSVNHWTIVATPVLLLLLIPVLLLSLFLNNKANEVPPGCPPGTEYYHCRCYTEEELESEFRKEDSLNHLQQIEDSLRLVKSKRDSSSKKK